MPMIDEGMTWAVSGQVSPFPAQLVFCRTISERLISGATPMPHTTGLAQLGAIGAQALRSDLRTTMSCERAAPAEAVRGSPADTT